VWQGAELVAETLAPDAGLVLVNPDGSRRTLSAIPAGGGQPAGPAGRRRGAS